MKKCKRCKNVNSMYKTVVIYTVYKDYAKKDDAAYL